MPAWAPLVVITAVFALLVIQTWKHTVDDAFISFRYARNLAHGWGLVFNEGERVEGYTNFLWVLLSAIPEVMGFSTEVFAKVVGVSCSLGILAAISSPRNELSPVSRWIPAAFLAVNPSFVVWTTSGLETPLFALLVTLGVLRAAWQSERDATDQIAAVLLGLAALTRPEGTLVAGTIALLYGVLALKGRIGWSSWSKWSLTFLAIFVPYFIWRYAYYGYLLPNPFYAKVGFGLAQVSRGLSYLNAFLGVSGYWLVPLLIGLWWARRPRLVAFLGTTLGVFVTYIVLVGGDALPMYRFFAPLVGLFYLLVVGLGIEGVIKRWGNRPRVLTAGVYFLIVALGWTIRPVFVGSDYQTVQKDIKEVWTWRMIGGWFRQHASQGESLAVIPAGALPYFSRLRALDMLGLNDLTIAHKEMVGMGKGGVGHEKYDVAHVLKWKPTYVLVGVYRLHRELRPPEEMIWPYYGAELELIRSSEFQQAYQLQSASVAGGYFYYYVRRAT